jgi:hypothetical protein
MSLSAYVKNNIDLPNPLLLIIISYCQPYSNKPKIKFERLRKYGEIYIIKQLTNDRIIGMTIYGFTCLWNYKTGKLMNVWKNNWKYNWQSSIDDAKLLDSHLFKFKVYRIYQIDTDLIACELNDMNICIIDLSRTTNRRIHIESYSIFESALLQNMSYTKQLEKCGYLIFHNQATNYKMHIYAFNKTNKLIKSQNIEDFKYNDDNKDPLITEFINKHIYCDSLSWKNRCYSKFMNSPESIMDLTNELDINKYIKSGTFVLLKYNCLAIIERLPQDTLLKTSQEINYIISICDILENKRIKIINVDGYIYNMFPINEKYLAVTINSIVYILDPFAASGCEAIEGKPSLTNEAIEGKPSLTNEAIEGKPSLTNEAIKGKPSLTNEAIKGKPSLTNEAIKGKPSLTSEVIKGKPSLTSETIQIIKCQSSELKACILMDNNDLAMVVNKYYICIYDSLF